MMIISVVLLERREKWLCTLQIVSDIGTLVNALV